jgi:asparagine N-glycosylation enzyme membrane subunit Stt3
MTDDSIKINTGALKSNIKKVINNKFTFLFSLLFVLTSLLLISKNYGIGSGISFIANLSAAFSTGLLLYLLIALALSYVLAYYGKFKWMFLPIVIWLLITTAIVRTSNIDLLRDVSTGDYTLGPDLDPFLYLRHAIEIDEGRLGPIDYFRQAPLGVKSYASTNIMPWTIYYFYKVISIFSDITVTYAAVILPVFLFIISLIGFLLFMRQIASFKMSREQSWIIALIASFFYAVIPSMLHRTVAGIPEIESLGMAFFWFAFLFFILAWKTESRKKQMIFGALAGLFTGAMSFSWGGYRFIYMILAAAIFALFLFGKDKERIFVVFSSWAIPALILEFLKVKSIINMIMGFGDVGFGIFVLFIIWIDFILHKTKIEEKSFLKKINLPNPIKSVIIGLLLAFIVSLILNPSFTINLFSIIIDRLLYPFGRERISLTVAENKAPYLTEVLQSFGNLFWIFLLGNILLFYEATKHFGKNKKFLFNLVFLIFILALVFTKFSPTSMFNGENFISKFTYLGSILLFIFVLLFTYLRAHIKKDEKTIIDFKEIDFHYIILLSFAFWAMVSMRGAIRLFFMISPMMIITSSFVPVMLWGYFKRSKDLTKMFIGILLITTIVFFIGTFAVYSATTSISAQNTAPSSYTQQWQKAMSWVRDNTPEMSIFVHWWDYGYWVQTLGERPTLTDGAHANAWWDHTTARYLLTTPNPETALSLMKTHGVSYLLIDSTDLGKYPAYSSIGSDADSQDRFSQIAVMVSDPSQTMETANGEARVYQGSTIVDEDIVYSNENGSVFLPTNRAFVIGMIIETSESSNTSLNFQQPTVVYFYNNQQFRLPLRYIYYNGEIIDFGNGIEGTARITQSLSVTGQGVTVDQLGSVIYLSPKLSQSLFAQLYLMDDVFNNYETITLAYSQPDPIVESLRAQGLGVDDIIYFQGFRGPIKIWKTEYPENILTHEEFLRNSGEYAGLDNLQFVS